MPARGPEVGQALVTHPQVATIAFTGSKTVGLDILNEAAHVSHGQTMVKRVIAEIGWKERHHCRRDSGS
ncbi:MAG: aldehyde dehydrogenase family protein [Nitrospira sp.]|nr:aldehyde dehydrogenase family protein [Nitrospira sp.]